jgi:hypothetical protein
MAFTSPGIDTKKAGEKLRPEKVQQASRLLGEQHVAGLLDRLRHAALLLGGETGVLARQNLAGVGHVAAHQGGIGERKFLRREAALGGGGFGRAHLKKRWRTNHRPSPCQPTIPPGSVSI